MRSRYSAYACNVDDTIATIKAVAAEATLEIALAEARAEMDAKHGARRDAQGQVIDFWIVGMGKLGARELNEIGRAHV